MLHFVCIAFALQVGHWEEEGCDLWEEVRSDDFFWNRMVQDMYNCKTHYR